MQRRRQLVDLQVTVRDEDADGSLLAVFELELPHTLDVAGLIALRAAREAELHNAALGLGPVLPSWAGPQVDGDWMHVERRHLALLSAFRRKRLTILVDDVPVAGLADFPAFIRGSAVTFRFAEPPAVADEPRLGPRIGPSS